METAQPSEIQPKQGSQGPTPPSQRPPQVTLPQVTLHKGLSCSPSAHTATALGPEAALGNPRVQSDPELRASGTRHARPKPCSPPGTRAPSPTGRAAVAAGIARSRGLPKGRGRGQQQGPEPSAHLHPHPSLQLGAVNLQGKRSCHLARVRDILVRILMGDENGSNTIEADVWSIHFRSFHCTLSY